MAPFEHIIYPIDFSTRCNSARALVLAMAREMKAPLTLLHSIPMPRGWYGGVEGAYPAFFDVEALERDAARRLHELAADPAFTGVDVICRTSQGDPAIAITEYANTLDQALIMIPTHGGGKFRSLLLGSVTAKVLHDATCAVWTDAHVENPESFPPKAGNRRILVGVALDGKDEPLIRTALALADGPDASARVRLVHAVPVEEVRPQKYFSLEFDRFLMDLEREKMADLQKSMGVELQSCVRGGRISTVMQETATLHHADLLVIGRGVVKETLGRLRTNAYAIIRDAPCPVLSV